MTYIYKRQTDSGVIDEVVKLERWVWGVVYTDGTELHQFDNSTQSFHQFNEIRQDDVKMFVMHKADTLKQRIDIPLVPGENQIFHFYRRIGLEIRTENERELTVYAFGWKNKQTGACTYVYILPDDRLVVCDSVIPDFTQYDI